MKANVLTVLAMLVSAVALSGCSQQGEQQAGQMEMSAGDMAAVETAMATMRQAWKDAYEAGDAAGVAALYATDADYMLPYAETVHGRAAIEQAVSETMAEMENRQVEITQTEQGVSGDLAYGVGTFTLSAEAMGEPVENVGKYLVIAKRQADGSWKIQAHIWNSNLPEDMEDEGMESGMMQD